MLCMGGILFFYTIYYIKRLYSRVTSPCWLLVPNKAVEAMEMHRVPKTLLGLDMMCGLCRL